MVFKEFDKTKEKMLYEKEIEIETGNTILLTVTRYDNQIPKIGVVRKIANQDGWGFRRVGRIGLDEFNKLKEVIPESLKVLENESNK